jgi:hypothetical protein
MIIKSILPFINTGILYLYKTYKMYKYTDTDFTPKQNRNYKLLRFLYNIVGLIAGGSIVLPFVIFTLDYFLYGIFHIKISLEYPYFPTFICAIILLFITRKFTNRCFECFKFNTWIEKGVKEFLRAFEWEKYGFQKTKSDTALLLVVKQLKCSKCGFECEQISQRTGHLDGIARMSRDIKKGGKQRLKGESYINWWRRNKM